MQLVGYDGLRGPDAAAKLNRMIASGPFEVHVGGVFARGRIADAHRRLETHGIGKLVLRMDAARTG